MAWDGIDKSGSSRPENSMECAIPLGRTVLEQAKRSGRGSWCHREEGSPPLFKLLFVRSKAKQTRVDRYKKTHLEEHKHEHSVWAEADERRRPSLEEELGPFFPQRARQDLERRLARGLWKGISGL